MAPFTQIFSAMVVLVVSNNAAPNKEISLKLPEECKGKGFCFTKPEGYDEMIKSIEGLLTPAFIEKNTGNRIGQKPKAGVELSPEEDWHNCPYRKTTIESVYAYNQGNKTDYFIQHELFRQPLEKITCAYDKIVTDNASEQCFQHLGFSRLNINSKCKTSTADRTFYVLNTKTMKLEDKPFAVPCCCTCHLSKD